jgi:hypothetical protein
MDDKTDQRQVPVPLLDKSRPNGLGSPSNGAPALPSRQAVEIPKDFPRKRSK